jgi:hypothetical protein
MRRVGVLVLGVVLLAAAVSWRPVVSPRIVKFPGGLNQTSHYQGTVVLSVNQSTDLPLAQALTLPLEIDRHVQSVTSGAHVAVLHETITAHLGPETVTQDNVYALNRRTMENVADTAAYTIAPTSTLDRAGSYYLTYPMGVPATGAGYRAWKPETGTTYPISSTALPESSIDGTPVVGLTGQLPQTPVDSAETAALAAQGFPTQMTGAQFETVLHADGTDLAAATASLAGVLTTAELATLRTALSQPVPLHYVAYGHGTLAVNPTSGAIVALTGLVDSIGVRPGLVGLAPALAVLTRHSVNPQVASLLGLLHTLAAGPAQPVYQLRYSQTPESVTASAAFARSQAHKIRLATVTIPFAIGIAGLLVTAAGVFLVLRRRPTAQVHDLGQILPTARRAAA